MYSLYRYASLGFHDILFDSDVNAEMLSHTENKNSQPFSCICLHNIIILWQG